MNLQITNEDLDLCTKLISLMTKKNITVATAESCTGGLLATLLTEVSGSSQVYKGGVCCYANEIKEKILKVPADIITYSGAVSEEVASLMAEGIRHLFSVDFGLSVTGIAGPEGGSVQKPVGTVWCAINHKELTKVFCLHLKGQRHDIRKSAALNVLHELFKVLQK